MDIQIRDFQGCERGDLSLKDESITILSSGNRRGKTSTLRAVRAILSDIKKVEDLAPAEVVTVGRHIASVKRIDNGAEQSICWQHSGATQEAEHTRVISDHSAGHFKLTEFKSEERAAFLIDLLDAKPSEQEIANALTDVGLTPKDERFVKLLETLDVLGWNRAAAEEEEKQRTQKSEWCKLTSKPRWIKDGLSWLPLGWSEDLRDMSEGALQKAIGDIEALIEQAIASEAVSEHEIARMRELANGLDAADEGIKHQTEKIETLGTDLNVSKKLLETMPIAGAAEQTIKCHACSAEQVIRDGKSCQPIGRKYSVDQEKKVMADRKVQSEKIVKQSTELRAAETELAAFKEQQRQAFNAAEKLRNLGTAMIPAPSTSSAELKQQLDKARVRLAAFRAKQAANAKYREAEQTIRIAELLKPEGLRLKKLTQLIGNFNDNWLRPLTLTAGWGAVHIDSDLRVMYWIAEKNVALPYSQLSGGERFAVDATIAIAIARIKQDRFILLDECQMLEPIMLNGLVKVLLKTKQGAVVAMMRPEPPLIKHKDVSVYILENGVARLVSCDLATAQ